MTGTVLVSTCRLCMFVCCGRVSCGCVFNHRVCVASRGLGVTWHFEEGRNLCDDGNIPRSPSTFWEEMLFRPRCLLTSPRRNGAIKPHHPPNEVHYVVVAEEAWTNRLHTNWTSSLWRLSGQTNDFNKHHTKRVKGYNYFILVSSQNIYQKMFKSNCVVFLIITMYLLRRWKLPFRP